MKGLIVTADDFGAAREVNEAVELAHRDGVLTAASLMVGAPAAADAVAIAKANPRLRVGLHLVLVEGRPVLPARDVPDLVDADGAFRTDLARLGAAVFFLPRARAQAAREIEAQFAAFAATGLVLDHVNAHRHYHLHPTIAALILDIGARFGAAASRVPCEPHATLAAIERGSPSAEERLVALFARRLRARIRRAGWLVPDQVFGLRWSGAMTRERLGGLLAHAPAGLTEIYLHPATNGGFSGAAPRYRYAEELAALQAAETRAAAACFVLGGFADFQDGGELATNAPGGSAA